MKINATSNAVNPKNSREQKSNGVRRPARAEEPKGGGANPGGSENKGNPGGRRSSACPSGGEWPTKPHT